MPLHQKFLPRRLKICTPPAPSPRSAEEYAALHRLCFETPRPWSAHDFKTLPKAAFFIEAPHGFLVAQSAGAGAEILTLAVHPNHRRQGIGRFLLAGFEQEALRRKSTTCFLEVAANNDTARAFYEKADYHQIGVRQNYLKTPKGVLIDAYLLQKHISLKGE